jgi:hypothetical protein
MKITQQKPLLGQLWQHNRTKQCYRIIDASDDYKFAGDLLREWGESTDRPALRAEIESLVGMVLYRRMCNNFVRREADFLKKFTLISDAE